MITVRREGESQEEWGGANDFLANESCNSCASLAGLVLCFIACFTLLVIAEDDELL